MANAVRRTVAICSKAAEQQYQMTYRVVKLQLAGVCQKSAIGYQLVLVGEIRRRKADVRAGSYGGGYKHYCTIRLQFDGPTTIRRTTLRRSAANK